MINAVQLAKISSNSLPSFQANDKEAEVFIEEAEKALENVESETNWGKTISRSIFKTASKRNNHLSIIALWHFENGLEKLSQAIKNLEHAKFFNPSPKCQQYINLKLKGCLAQRISLFSHKQKMEAAVQI